MPHATFFGYEGLGDPLQGKAPRYSGIAEKAVDLHIDVTDSDVYAGLEDFYQLQALEAAALLNRLAGLSCIDLLRSRRIIDFGSGAGGPTLALARLAELNGGSVDALERNAYQLRSMARTGIVPADRTHDGDGLKFLGRMAARRETCDLITAFMLGPDVHGELTDKLVAAAEGVLEPTGHLLITSDPNTIGTVRKACDQARVGYDYVVGVPDTLIASFPAT